MIMVRVNDGLVAMEKSDSESGKQNVIRHNRKAHGNFPTRGHASRGSLSFAQKEYVARYYDKQIFPDVFVTKMMSNKTTPCRPDQIGNQKRFKRAVYDFINRNKKVLIGFDMDRVSLEVMMEILDVLRELAEKRACEPTPIGKSNDPYYQSDYWKNYVWRYIVLISLHTNITTGKLVSVLLAPVDLRDRARDMGQAFPCNEVQLEGELGLRSFAHMLF